MTTKNRFNRIKEKVEVDILNAGKKYSEATIEENINKSLEDDYKSNVKEQIHKGVEEQKSKKLKRSFMLTPMQIQMLGKIKMDYFILNNKEIDLSEIVGRAIQEYYKMEREIHTI